MQRPGPGPDGRPGCRDVVDEQDRRRDARAGHELGMSAMDLLRPDGLALRDFGVYPAIVTDIVDPDGIVYTEHGCLFRLPITSHGPGARRLLRDFNGDHFEARAAPY